MTAQELILYHLWIHLGLNIKHHVSNKGDLLCLAWTSAQRPDPCHALVYTFETLLGRFDSKQSCPKSVRIGSQQMELNNHQVCHLLDRRITSDGSVFPPKKAVKSAFGSHEGC